MPESPPEPIVVLCTCQTEAEAERIAAALVSQRLAACVNILPPIRSIYRWQDVIEDARETLLLIKTMAARFSALEEQIKALHSYEVPEIIALPVTAGSEPYLAWLAGQVS